MNRSWNILILIIIYLICSARGCVEDPESSTRLEQDQINGLKGNVETIFTSGILPPEFVKASEVTAIQKLNDFSDYLRIAADTSLEIQFRKQAADMITSLFRTGKIDIGPLKKFSPDITITTLEELLLYSLSEGLPYQMNLSGISISKPLSQLNDSIYYGDLSFNYTYRPLTAPDTSNIASGNCFIHISLSRILKPFGSHNLKVWEVKLGEIY